MIKNRFSDYYKKMDFSKEKMVRPFVLIGLTFLFFILLAHYNYIPNKIGVFLRYGIIGLIIVYMSLPSKSNK